MANKKESRQMAPTFGDLRENHGAGSCGCGNAAKSPRSDNDKLTAEKSELPDLTRPTR